MVQLLLDYTLQVAVIQFLPIANCQLPIYYDTVKLLPPQGGNETNKQTPPAVK
jgi:hypothetical protein